MRRTLVMVIAFTLMVGGCLRREPVHVASKDFAENRILAEIFVSLLKEADIPVRSTIPYGNTFDLQEAIKDGEIDLYPEYTGTGLVMMGLPAMGDGDLAMVEVQSLFGRYGMKWLERLGFNNSYVLVMEPNSAVRYGVKNISDLVGLETELRIGCEEEFLARPVDGYQPLIRRYGFSPEPTPVVADSRDKLYRDLVTGQTLVAVVQRTDPQIQEFNLRIIDDNFDFFPAYECAPLVRESVLDRFSDLGSVLEQLSDRITDRAMREMNRAVALDGLDAYAVAQDFLVDQGLIKRKPVELVERKLIVAVPPLDHRSTTLAKALGAVREALPNRQVELQTFASPADALLQGLAFVAIVGAEHFFRVRPDGLPEARDDMEAIVPVGFRSVHLIRPRRAVAQKPFSGINKLGVGPAYGGSEQIGRILLDAYEATEAVEMVTGNIEEQIGLLFQDQGNGLDAVLVSAVAGDAQLTMMLEDERLSLQPILEWERRDRQFRYPFLRIARIAKNIYPHLRESTETVGAQVVLAGPLPGDPTLGDGDPVSGLRVQRQRIPHGVKQSLIAAVREKETIDPALPGERIAIVTARREVQPLNPAPEVSAVTALFFLAMGSFFYLLMRQNRKKE